MSNTSSSSEPTPLTRRLKERLPPARWAAIERRAHERAEIIKDVAAARASGLSHRDALELVAPGVQWPTSLNWCRRADEREGAAWERPLDARVPPRPERVAAEVLAAACLLRRQDPTISCDTSRKLLVEQFGAERGKVSPTVLRRTWKEAGLAQPGGG